MPVGRLVEDRDNATGVVYFGPTSLETLMLDFGELLPSPIDPELQKFGDDDSSIRERIKTFVDASQHKCPRETPSPPTEPPLVILEGMMVPYFSKINPHFPIWSRGGFDKILESLRQHSTSLEDDWASIVCCNNLILINLTMDSVHSAQQRMVQSGSNGSLSSMGSELIAGFLANTKRAIENIGLLSPRLLNVQALLSSVGSSRP